MENHDKKGFIYQYPRFHSYYSVTIYPKNIMRKHNNKWTPPVFIIINNI